MVDGIILIYLLHQLHTPVGRLESGPGSHRPPLSIGEQLCQDPADYSLLSSPGVRSSPLHSSAEPGEWERASRMHAYMSICKCPCTYTHAHSRHKVLHTGADVQVHAYVLTETALSFPYGSDPNNHPETVLTATLFDQ